MKSIKEEELEKSYSELRDEYSDLCVKIRKINNALEDSFFLNTFADLPQNLQLMQIQLETMETYKSILAKRLDIFEDALWKLEEQKNASLDQIDKDDYAKGEMSKADMHKELEYIRKHINQGEAFHSDLSRKLLNVLDQIVNEL